MGQVLFWGKVAYFGKWRISHLSIDSSFSDSNFSDLKNVSSSRTGGNLFCLNLPLPQTSTFSLRQKRFAYYRKSAYYECAYYKWAQYIILILYQ